jgi:hypothetical protein
MPRAPVASRTLLVVAVVVLGACEVVPPVNPFDPATRPEDHAVAVIDGTVVGADGEPLVGGTVTLTSATEVRSADIVEGAFLLGDLTPGSWALDIEHPFHFPLSRDVVLGPGDRRTFVLQLVAPADSPILDTTPPTLLSPVAVEPVVVTDGTAYVTSVSVTLAVLAEGADKMAIVVDGVYDTEPLQPYAAASVVVLPAGDGEKTICVALSDIAGNERPIPTTLDGDGCVTVTLDATRPASPIVLNEDGAVRRSPPDGTLPVLLAPVDDDVVEAIVSVENAFDEVATVTRFPVDAGAVAPLILAVPVRTPPANREILASLIRVKVRDAAGNESDQGSVTVILDDTAPGAPVIADADRKDGEPLVFLPRQNPNANAVQVRPPKVNADTFAVRIQSRVGAVDATFDHYEIARTVGATLSPPPGAFTETAGTDGLLFPLVQGAPLNGFPGDTPGCSPRACLNHLFIRAVDAAGNVGPTVRIDVIEDSGPPTRPTLSPRAGTLRGAEADVRVEVESVDDSDICASDADCARGVCDTDRLFCIGADGEDGLAVRAYELKQGDDGAFGGVPAGQPVAGPYRVSVLRDDVSTVCVRGVDDAGNVGLEDCVDFIEASTVGAVATAGSENGGAIAGDFIAYLAGGSMRLRELRRSAPERPDDDILLADERPNAFLDLEVRLAIAPGGRLKDRLTFVFDSRNGETPVLDLRQGFVDDGFASRRIGSAFAPSLGGDVLAFGCGDGSVAQPFRVAVLDTNRFAEIGSVDVPCSNRGVVVATLPTGTTLCPDTTPRVQGNTVVWCEETGSTARIRMATSAAPLTGPFTVSTLSSAPASRSAGSLVGLSGRQQPLVTTTSVLWAEVGNSGQATLRRQLRVGGPAIDTGIIVDNLLDADREQVLFGRVRSGGLTDDLFVVDLAASTTPQRLTDDLPPNTSGTIHGGRIATTDLSSTSEDVILIDLTTEAWLESSESFRLSPHTSEQIAVWLDVSDTRFGLLAEEIATGLQFFVTSNPDEVTFIGGSFLGRAPWDVGGRRIAFGKRNADGRTWTVRVREPPSPGAPPADIIIPDLLAIDDVDTRGQPVDASTTFALSPAGDVIAFVDAAGQVRVESLQAGVRSTLIDRALPFVDTAPFVDVDTRAGAVVAVVQLDNVGDGDERREGFGGLHCAARSAAGVVTGGTITLPATVVGARAPSVAFTPGGPIAAMTVGVDEGGGRRALRTAVCRLSCDNTPTCDDFTVLPGGPSPDQRPVVTGTGLVVWPSGLLGLPQIARYDVERRLLTFLTTPDDGEVARESVDAGGDVVVWLDSRLGTSDVWTGSLR